MEFRYKNDFKNANWLTVYCDDLPFKLVLATGSTGWAEEVVVHWFFAPWLLTAGLQAVRAHWTHQVHTSHSKLGKSVKIKQYTFSYLE